MTRKISACLLLAAVAVMAGSREEYARAFDKSLTWKPGDHISVENRFGDVSVHTRPEATVSVHADIRVSAAGADEARSFADRIDVSITQGDSGISIRTIYPGGGREHGRYGTSYSVRYDIMVPESAPIDVRSSFGRAMVAGCRAGARVTSAYGQTEIHDIMGPLSVENSFAATLISNVKGDLTVHTKYGKLTADRVQGNLDISNAFGPVDASLQAATGACQTISIHNSYAPIRIHLPGDAGYKVSAHTKYGHIRSDFPLTVTGAFSSDDLSGTIGSGRCEMSLVNSFAPIEILRGGSSASSSDGAPDAPVVPHDRGRGPKHPENPEPPSVPEPPQPPNIH